MKLFRNLRISFIQKQNFKKYLLYAIGEILLVMIGILLALQVNNWNEQIKSDQEGCNILFEMRENSGANISHLQAEIVYDQSVMASAQIVIDNLSVTQVYHDSLGFHFLNSTKWPEHRWEDAGYEMLESRGLRLIESDMLRKSIVSVYETEHQSIQEAVRVTENYAQAVLFPLVTKYFSTDLEESANVTDYDLLIRSKEYVNFLTYWYGYRNYNMQVRSDVIYELEALNNLLTEELNSC